MLCFMIPVRRPTTLCPLSMSNLFEVGPMQRYCFPVLVLLSLIVPLQAADSQPAIGASIGELKFKDIRGLNRSFSELGKKQAYVLVFTSTQCPLVKRSMPKLVDIDTRFGPRGVQVVAVNVGLEDSIRDMAAQAIEYEASFPFVKDTDLSCVKALGIDRTPEVALLNADRVLVFRGRIDDQYRLGGSRPEPTRRDLEEALNELLDGKKISVAETPVDGCLIAHPIAAVKEGPVPTFHKDIAPVLNKRCVACHREGAAGPFALTSYSDAKAHAEMMSEVITDLRMPPWYAHSKPGMYQNDPSLTREERETVVRWVNSGRPEGDPKDAPELPAPSSAKWRIGEPDMVVSMLDEHQIPATGYIPYKEFLLPYVFFNETWLEAIEIRPDNPAVVHHCNMAYVTSKGAGNETFITGHVPGGQPMDLGRFDNGLAYRVPALATLGLQVHYTTTGKEERCKISVGFRFPKQIVHKQLKHFLLDPHRIQIAPGDGAFPIKAAKQIDQDVTLLGLFTHMHVRGKDMTFYAHLPDQTRDTLLQIPNYNFEWQLGYEIAPGKKKLPKGTKIEAIAHYDNSTFNPYNPDPKRTVPYGLQTYDEMFNGYGFFVADDEDLNLTVNPKTGVAVAPKAK